MNIILIDGGHSARDSGAIGADGTLEKDANLHFSLLLGEALSRLDPTLDIRYTRQDDSALSLKERVEIEHRLSPNLFISVHCNASDTKKGSGFEVYYSSTKGQTVANSILAEVQKDFNIHGVGVFKKDFYVLKYTKSIAVLLELFFIDNLEDSKILDDVVRSTLLVQQIVQGVMSTSNIWT